MLILSLFLLQLIIQKSKENTVYPGPKNGLRGTNGLNRSSGFVILAL